jgi:hypothetical protein
MAVTRTPTRRRTAASLTESRSARSKGARVTVRTSIGPSERAAGCCALSRFERLPAGPAQHETSFLITRNDCQAASRRPARAGDDRTGHVSGSVGV